MNKVMKAVAALMLMGTAMLFVNGCTSEEPANTFTVSGSIGGHEYVDLGLPSGTLWATCNLGAETPEGYGDYFAWGENSPKPTYNWSTYQYCMGDGTSFTKYCTDSIYGYNGFTDNLTVLWPIDDAALVNWGTGWHVPTMEQWKELRDNTTHAWTVQNGVNGYLLTADNGGQLFLPAAGYRKDDTLNSVGVDGIYWSSSLYVGIPDGAYDFGFTASNVFVDLYYRYQGQSIRPVCSAQ